jgi:hypothetical protein
VGRKDAGQTMHPNRLEFSSSKRYIVIWVAAGAWGFSSCILIVRLLAFGGGTG